MFYLLTLLIAGISLAPIVLGLIGYEFNIWQAQGAWVQVGILFCLSRSFFENPNTVKLKNKPLGVLHCWVGFYSAYVSYVLHDNKIGIETAIFPYLNFLTLLLLYRFIIEYLDKAKIEIIMDWLRRVIIFTLFICVLQRFGLSGKNFYLIMEGHGWLNNMVSGFIGNGTHLSGFLAMCVPLFLFKITRENILALILMALVMLYTSTTKNDPAISGYIIAASIILMYQFKTNPKYSVFTIAGIVFVVFCVWIGLDDISLKKLLSDNARFEIWGYYWGVFSSPESLTITGLGPGKIWRIFKMTPYPQAMHLHLEYFQFLVEYGWLGLILICYLIKDFFERPILNRTQLMLFLIVFGFLISCFFTYPAHLWLVSTTAMFAYASFMAIENGVSYGTIKERIKNRCS